MSNNDKLKSHLDASIIHIQSMLETSIKMQAHIIAHLEEKDYKEVYKSAVEEIKKNDLATLADLKSS